jgi:hypothetical protein
MVDSWEEHSILFGVRWGAASHLNLRNCASTGKQPVVGASASTSLPEMIKFKEIL